MSSLRTRRNALPTLSIIRLHSVSYCRQSGGSGSSTSGVLRGVLVTDSTRRHRTGCGWWGPQRFPLPFQAGDARDNVAEAGKSRCETPSPRLLREPPRIAALWVRIPPGIGHRATFRLLSGVYGDSPGSSDSATRARGALAGSYLDPA